LEVGQIQKNNIPPKGGKKTLKSMPLKEKKRIACWNRPNDHSEESLICKSHRSGTFRIRIKEKMETKTQWRQQR